MKTVAKLIFPITHTHQPTVKGLNDVNLFLRCGLREKMGFLSESFRQPLVQPVDSYSTFNAP